MLTQEAKAFKIHPSQKVGWKKVDPIKLGYQDRLSFAAALGIEEPEKLTGEELIEAIKAEQKKLKGKS